MGLYRRSAADQGCGPIDEGSKCDPGRRHSGHWPHAQLFARDHAGPPTESAPHCRVARQAVAAETTHQGRLHRVQYSRQVCGRLRIGLCGKIPEFAGYLRGPARRLIATAAGSSTPQAPDGARGAKPGCYHRNVEMVATKADVQSKIDPLLLEVADVVNTTLD